MTRFTDFQVACEKAVSEIAEAAGLVFARTEIQDPIDATATGIKLVIGNYSLWLYSDGAQIDGYGISHRLKIESYRTLDEMRTHFVDLTQASLLSFIGPHEGSEYDRMIAGQKHLSMFVLEGDQADGNYPDPRFDALVASGRLIRDEKIERQALPSGEISYIRRILYASVEEAWRIPAMHMVDDIYRPLLPGRRPDLERIIGALLGYDPVDVEQWLNWLATRSRSA